MVKVNLIFVLLKQQPEFSRNMKIVIAPDSFKGSLSSPEAAEAIEAGIKKVSSSIETVKVPMADGGEGTAAALVGATGGILERVTVCDPLLRNTSSYYGILGDGCTAVIEMAAASGLVLLLPSERNPLLTSTYGTGQLILNALDRGCRKFIIGLGGSATNDGGTGMAKALGFRFTDIKGRELNDGGADLSRLHKIDVSGADSRIATCSFIAACDVQNPLTGPDGASAVFGPQKGASPDDVHVLDHALSRLSQIIQNDFGINPGIVPGAGAAGGMGAGVLFFLKAELKKGFAIVAEVTQLADKMKDASLVITGEGQSDYQTLMGKTPFGVAMLARKLGIPVLGISGSLGKGHDKLLAEGFTALHSLTGPGITAEYSVANAAGLLEKKTEEVIEELIRNRTIQ